MIPHVHAQRFPRAAEGPIALVITPTRELAAQIAQICEGFRKKFGIRTLCVQGRENPIFFWSLSVIFEDYFAKLVESIAFIFSTCENTRRL